MKTISKLLVILLTLALVFSLVACGDAEDPKNESETDNAETESAESTSEATEETEATEATEATDATEATEEVTEELLGAWHCTMDFSKVMDAMKESGADEAEIAMSEKLYAGISEAVYTIDLKEDGTFTMSIDEETVTKLAENMAEVLPDLLAGMSGMTREDYEAYLEGAGMTMDDVLAQLGDAFSVENLTKSMTGVNGGTYTYEDGKLTLTNETGESIVFTVELGEDELTVTAVEAEETNPFPEELLPLVFVR